jgi:hypothetical protein
MQIETRFLEGDFALVRLGLGRGILGLTGSPLCKVGLVPLSLRVGQVIPLIIV